MTPDRNERDLLEKDSDPSARREAAFRRWRKRTPDKRATRTDRRCAWPRLGKHFTAWKFAFRTGFH